jgi:hypothetical protein
MHLLLQRKLRRISPTPQGSGGSGACAPSERVGVGAIVGLNAMAASACKVLPAEVLDVRWPSDYDSWT